MANCPCQDCPERKLTCHDRCDAYMEYHDALVAAREALKVADSALGLLRDGYLDALVAAREALKVADSALGLLRDGYFKRKNRYERHRRGK